MAVLHSRLLVEVDGKWSASAPRETVRFPAAQWDATVEVQPPVETVMVGAPTLEDKVY